MDYLIADVADTETFFISKSPLVTCELQACTSAVVPPCNFVFFYDTNLDFFSATFTSCYDFLAIVDIFIGCFGRHLGVTYG